MRGAGVLLLVAVSAGIGLVVQAKRDSGRLLALAQAFDPGVGRADIAVRYPMSETVFPPNVPPPRLVWSDAAADSRQWLVRCTAGGGCRTWVARTKAPGWTPDGKQWEAIQRALAEAPVRVAVLGLSAGARPTVTSHAAELTLRGSADPVDGVLFYREVKPPFSAAAADLSRVRWRCGSITDPDPPVILTHPTVCGNCHSFSLDGQWMGIDFDYKGNKSAYALLPVQKRMTVPGDAFMHWDAYAAPQPFETTGFASQVSPDGRFVVTAIQELFVSIPVESVKQSLIYFPIRGILAVYDRERRSVRALPGADDPAYVHCNAVWSPDGRQIVFARAAAGDVTAPKKGFILSEREGWAFLRANKEYRYDLCVIPFNEGKGGTPRPLPGASQNGKSNFFPKCSPDGRWIVFCQSKHNLFLQPDSRLCIVPAEGGAARLLRCNLEGMNSWHSWSPNGRWLVFTSDTFSPFSQLFITHIDRQGNSSPPVALPHLTAPDWAINVPEFMSRAPAIERLSLAF